MAIQPEERFELKVDPDPDQYLSRDIQRGRAKTANMLTIMLIGAVLVAPLIYVAILIWGTPQAAKDLLGFYEKWFALVGPLAGTAFGVYVGSGRQNR